MSFLTGEGTYKTGLSTVLKFIFFLGLGILIIWLSLRNLTATEKTEIINAFHAANYNWVALAIVLGIISHIVRTLRWMLFFEPMGYRPSVKNTFYAVMVGYFANMAFPRLGEVSRCGVLAKYENIPFNKAFGSVITERAVDLILFFLLFLLTIVTQIGTIDNYLDTKVYPKIYEKIQNPATLRLILYGSVAGILFLAAVLILFRKKIGHTKIGGKIRNLIAGFWEGLKSLMLIRKPFLFVFYSVLIWVLYYLMLYVCFFCFPETSGLSLGAGLSALVLGSVGIMITPGGIGLYPAILQETLKPYGTALTTGLALGWISWAAQTSMILFVGGLSLILLSFNKNRNGKAKRDQV